MERNNLRVGNGDGLEGLECVGVFAEYRMLVVDIDDESANRPPDPDQSLLAMFYIARVRRVQPTAGCIIHNVVCSL